MFAIPCSAAQDQIHTPGGLLFVDRADKTARFIGVCDILNLRCGFGGRAALPDQPVGRLRCARIDRGETYTRRDEAPSLANVGG